MSKFLFTLISLAVLVFFIMRDTWRVTLDTANYQISVSFILFVTGLVLLWWILGLLKAPFAWIARFKAWRKAKTQAKKDQFLPALLTTLLAHETDKSSGLIQEAKRLYGAKSEETLLTTALLAPQTEVFEELNQTESTKMAGLYGLVQEAEKLGDFNAIADLLEQVPVKQQKTLWIQKTRMKLALNRNDWQEALTVLEANKQYLPRATYHSYKACLLLKLGKAKEAYRLAPAHTAIALAYAKVVPQKAISILEKTWGLNPSWPIYLAYKEAIQSLPEKKRLKAVLALTKATRDERYSLLARTDTDMELGNWARAKENLEIYLQTYPLTRQVADMMAHIERTAWHHEEQAIEWEQKAVESEDDTLWICRDCNRTAGEWHILCPHCNAFDTMYNK